MPTCRFSFTYKDNQLCVLEKRCKFKNSKDQLSCEIFHNSFYFLTPEDIERLKKNVISKLDGNPPSEKP